MITCESELCGIISNQCLAIRARAIGGPFSPPWDRPAPPLPSGDSPGPAAGTGRERSGGHWSLLTAREAILLGEQFVDLVLLGFLFEMGVLARELLHHLLEPAALLALVLEHALPLAAVRLHQVTVVGARLPGAHTGARVMMDAPLTLDTHTRTADDGSPNRLPTLTRRHRYRGDTRVRAKTTPRDTRAVTHRHS